MPEKAIEKVEQIGARTEIDIEADDAVCMECVIGLRIADCGIIPP